MEIKSNRETYIYMEWELRATDRHIHGMGIKSNRQTYTWNGN